MRFALPMLLVFLVCACSGGSNAPVKLDGLFKENAKGAEANLKKMREASIRYYDKHKAAPENVDDLAAFGGGPHDLKADKFYSELGYTLFHLKFDDKGVLVEGKFRATPMSEASAPIVMMDAKTQEFEYKAKDAPENAANEPAGTGIEIK